MKLRDCIKIQPLKTSAYPSSPLGNHVLTNCPPWIRFLMNCEVVRQVIPLRVGDSTYQLQVSILPESTAVIWHGMNDQRLKIPILCFDAEALCYELLEWRTRIGLKEKTRVPSDEADADEVACSLEVAIEEMFEDPFTQTLNDLAYQLFALALIESLPETHLDKR